MRQSLELFEKALSPDHPHVALSRHNLGLILDTRGKHAEAEAEYRRALTSWDKTMGADHPNVAALRNNLGLVLTAQGRHLEAEKEHRRALNALEKTLGADHPDTTALRSNLAGTLLNLGRPSEALPLARKAWDDRQRDEIPPEDQAESAFVLAQVLWESSRQPGDRTRARQLAERALEAYGKLEAPQDEKISFVKAWLNEHDMP